MTTGPAAPLRQDAARNRERLLAAAQQVFAERGLTAGVEEVARVAGVGMGTLYRRFPTKEALVEALVDALRRRLFAVAEAAVQTPDGRGLEHYLEASAALQAANHGYLARLWSYDDEDRTVVAHRRVVGRLLRDAQAHGRVRPELCETDVTMLLWSIRGVIETTARTAPDAWRRHLELLLAAMRPTGDPLTARPLTTAQARRAGRDRVDAARRTGR